MASERQKQAQIDLHKVLAREYDWVRRELIGTRMMNEYWDEEIYEWLPKGRELRVLDNMCGTGIFLDRLVSDFSFVVGADISCEMMSYAKEATRRKLKGLVCCDVEHLPFGCDTFDVVNIRGALHHVNPVRKALGEVHRVLRPSGRFIISEPCDDFVLVRRARELMYRHLSYFDAGERTFLSKDLVAAIRRAGFEVSGTKRFGFVSYALLGYPDVLPWLRWVNYLPFVRGISKGLIGMDRVLSRIPGLNRYSLVVFVVAEKRQVPLPA